MQERELRELESLYDCGGIEQAEGWLQLRNLDEEVVGRLSCSVDGEGDAQLRWVWDDLGTLGSVELRGGGAEGLSGLQSWWSAEADRT